MTPNYVHFNVLKDPNGIQNKWFKINLLKKSSIKYLKWKKGVC